MTHAISSTNNTAVTSRNSSGLTGPTTSDFERKQRDPCSFVDVRILIGKIYGERLHLAVGAFQTDFRLQPADDVHPHRDLAIVEPRCVPLADREIHVAG